MVNRFVFLAGLSVAAGLDASILSQKERHLINEDNKFCPYANATQEKLLYNIEIQIQGLDGCGDDVLLKVGTTLQQIVDEVVAEIPEYKNEHMQATICPMPIVEAARRGLRLAKSNRKLVNAGRYRYRGGGQCRRCRKNNNDRLLLQDALSYNMTCLNTDKDIYDAGLADLANTAVEGVGGAFLDLKVTALGCSNLRSGKALVAWANKTLEECKTAQKELRAAVETARAQCQQASLASSEAQSESLVRQAAETFGTAMKAVDKVLQLYSELKDKLKTTDVCNQPIEDAGDISSMADMAAFVAEMSETAFKKAKQLFSQLQERAMECGDSMTEIQLIESARAQLVASKKAKKEAVRKARISRRQAQKAKAAASQEELNQITSVAKESFELALFAAERARNSYYLISDELELPICGATQVPEEVDGAPLKEWLVGLMDNLYALLIPDIYYLMDNCTSENEESLYIHIDALEEWWEEEKLITKKDCDNLTAIPF